MYHKRFLLHRKVQVVEEAKQRASRNQIIREKRWHFVLHWPYPQLSNNSGTHVILFFLMQIIWSLKRMFFFLRLTFSKGVMSFCLSVSCCFLFVCLFVPFCCCLFVLRRFIFIFKEIWVLSFDWVVHSTHSSYNYFHNHSIVRTSWTVTAQTCQGRPRRFNFAEFKA